MAAIPDRLIAALGDRYRLVRELGTGGMATVYLAEDLKHHRQVAVKVLRPDLAVALGADRFLREIRIAARLSHPHILPLHDSGEADGFVYYVMPYVEGTSLRQKLSREGELPIPEAVRILRDLADAMAYAHAQGIVHRDIKPENVMLTGRHAVVMDFGVAKALGEAQSSGTSSLTSAGVALGTPAYMAPEQATGDAHVDARADLYAWGIVAYELLAGQPPFVRATPQNTLAAQVTATPEPVTAHRATVPGALATLVMQCLEKRPADRPQTAAELVTRLEAVLTPSGGMTPTDTRPYQTAAARRARRQRWIAGVVGVLGVALLGAGGWWVTSTRFTPLQIESNRPLVSTTEVEAQAALSPDGKLVVYAADPPDGGKDFKLYLRQVGGGSAVPLTASLSGHHQTPTWSPDGSTVFFVRIENGQPSGWVVPYMGGTPRQVIEAAPRPMFRPAFTPDGRHVLYGTAREVRAAPLTGGGDSVIFRGDPFIDFALSPDGSRLALTTGARSARLGGSTVKIALLPDGVPTPITDSVHLNRDPVWAPDGETLLYVSDAGGTADLYQVPISRTGGPASVPVRLTTGANPITPRFSADGRRMVYTVYEESSPIWSATIDPTGVTPVASLQPVTRQREIAAYLDVSPDGKWLSYDSDRGGNNDIYKVPAEGGDPIQLTRDPAPDFVGRWSPDGQALAYHSLRTGNRDIRVMDSDGLNDRPVTADSTSEIQPDWTPDGKGLVFLADGAVTLLSRDQDGQWGTRRQLTPSYPAGAERTRHGAAQPCWLGDGRAILYMAEGGLRLVAPTGGTPRILLAPEALGGLRGHACGPDPETVYATTFDGQSQQRFWAIPVAGGRPRLLLQLDGIRRETFNLATDGKRLFFSRPQEEGDIWVVEFRK